MTNSKFAIIRKEGGSKILTLTKFLPEKWHAVNIITIEENEDAVILKIEKVK